MAYRLGKIRVGDIAKKQNKLKVRLIEKVVVMSRCNTVMRSIASYTNVLHAMTMTSVMGTITRPSSRKVTNGSYNKQNDYRTKQETMQSTKLQNRTAHLPTVRLTLKEKDRVVQEFQKTHHSSLSDYVREKLFAKEVTAYEKKRMDALLQLGDFRTELKNLGPLIEQIAKLLAVSKDDKLLQSETEILQALLKEFSSINEHLDKMTIK